MKSYVSWECQKKEKLKFLRRFFYTCYMNTYQQTNPRFTIEGWKIITVPGNRRMKTIQYYIVRLYLHVRGTHAVIFLYFTPTIGFHRSSPSSSPPACSFPKLRARVRARVCICVYVCIMCMHVYARHARGTTTTIIIIVGKKTLRSVPPIIKVTLPKRRK